MKLIIDSEKMFKLAITPEGQLSINLANGKTLTGALSSEEVEQLHFRVMQVSDGALQFDPMPTDHIGRHQDDAATLEAQAIELDRLRGALENTKQAEQAALTAKSELETQLADCENLLTSARNELKNALEVVEQQAAKLNISKNEDSEFARLKEGAASSDAKPREGEDTPADGVTRNTELLSQSEVTA